MQYWDKSDLTRQAQGHANNLSWERGRLARIFTMLADMRAGRPRSQLKLFAWP